MGIMSIIKTDVQTLFNQASMAANDITSNAIERFNRLLKSKDVTVEERQDFIRTYSQTASNDFLCTCICLLADRLADSLDNVAEAIKERNDE